MRGRHDLRLSRSRRGCFHVVIFDSDGKFLDAWKQFGRPSCTLPIPSPRIRRALPTTIPAAGAHPRRQREGRQAAVFHSAPAGARSEDAAAD
jgi:hypothetical protein